MEQTIPFVENLGEELVRAIGRRPRRRVMTRRSLLLVAVGVLLAMAPAAAIVAQTVFGPTPGQLEAERRRAHPGQSPDPSIRRGTRRDHLDGRDLRDDEVRVPRRLRRHQGVAGAGGVGGGVWRGG